MMTAPDTLAELRRRIGRIERFDGCDPAALNEGDAVAHGLSLGHDDLDQAFVEGGLGFGVHQIAGDGAAAATFAATLLARLDVAHRDGVQRDAARLRPGLSRDTLVVQERAAVLEGGGLHGPGLKALGADPAAIVFVTARDARQTLRIADDALRSGALAAVVIELRRGERLLDLTLTQRFNMEAQRTQSLAFLLTSDLLDTSSALTRWRVRCASSLTPRAWLGPPRLELELTRNRRGRPGRWILEWNGDDRLFRTPASFPASVAAPSVHRPGPAHDGAVPQPISEPFRGRFQDGRGRGFGSARPGRQGEGRASASGGR